MYNSVGFLCSCFSCFKSKKGNIALTERFLKCLVFFYYLDVFSLVLELLSAVWCSVRILYFHSSGLTPLSERSFLSGSLE